MKLRDFASTALLCGGLFFGLVYGADAQSFPGRIKSGHLLANSTANEQAAQDTVPTAWIDRAFGTTPGTFLLRGSSVWTAAALSGDATLSSAGALTLATVNSNVGTFGSATQVGQYTVNAKGLITAASNVAIVLPLASGVSGQLSLANGGANASLTASNGGVVYSTASALAVLGGTVTANQCLLSGASAAPSWGACSGGASVTSIAGNTGAFTLSGLLTNSVNVLQVIKATAANFYAGASNDTLTSDNVFTPEVAITFNASQTLDFSTFLNGSVTLTGNITSLTCSNMKAGQAGVIRFIQDATGTRTMVSTWCTAFVWQAGTKGTLSTPASTIDALFYQCISTSVCLVSLGKAFL